MQWRMEDVGLGSITMNHIYIEPTSESESQTGPQNREWSISDVDLLIVLE